MGGLTLWGQRVTLWVDGGVGSFVTSGLILNRAGPDGSPKPPQLVVGVRAGSVRRNLE